MAPLCNCIRDCEYVHELVQSAVCIPKERVTNTIANREMVTNSHVPIAPLYENYLQLFLSRGVTEQYFHCLAIEITITSLWSSHLNGVRLDCGRFVVVISCECFGSVCMHVYMGYTVQVDQLIHTRSDRAHTNPGL